MSFGVYAYGSSSPDVIGHSGGEIKLSGDTIIDDTFCNKVTGVACGSASGGSVSWEDITGIPSDIADGDDVAAAYITSGLYGYCDEYCADVVSPATCSSRGGCKCPSGFTVKVIGIGNNQGYSWRIYSCLKN